MGRERRRQARYPTDIDGSLYLCGRRDGQRLSNSLDCRVVDFSRSGVGIISFKIFVDNQHFFYEALDSDEVLLTLKIATSRNSRDLAALTFLGRPVWFDRILDQESKPFKMGIEFLEKISDDEWKLLRELSSTEKM
ncbi:MAG: PilZ domain-containing protein [Thermodesulfobacteriota bacterium]